MSDYIGTDYGMGIKNIDPQTGIRYGVIHHSTVGQFWYEESEPEYPVLDAKEILEDEHRHFGSLEKVYEQYRVEFGDWETLEEALLEMASDYSDPIEFFIDTEGFTAFQDADSPEIIVSKSKWYTKAQFCSPYFPGAGNLDSPMEDGVETYCLPHDMFESGIAPYPVYEVATNLEVKPYGK